LFHFQPDAVPFATLAGLQFGQVGQGDGPRLAAQAVIDLAADIAHGRAVIADYKQPASAGLVEVAPFGLALFDILVGIPLHLNKQGGPLPIYQHQIGFEQAPIRQSNIGWRQVDLVAIFKFANLPEPAITANRKEYTRAYLYTSGVKLP
jgi:hypothetical protein